jgi:hypothetical protein
MPDSHYAAHCREVCEWCAKGLRLSKEPGGLRLVHVIAVEYDPAGSTTEYEYCLAPTIAQFAEQQARIAEIRRVKLEHAGEAMEKRREQVKNLERAIHRTVAENLHLADGEVCTLIHLKRALPEVEKYLAEEHLNG